MDYPGKLIRKTPLVPTQTSASGVWTMTEAMDAVKANSWPVAGIPKPMQQSLRFRSSASAYLSRTPASAGNRKTWTYSSWFKRGTLSVNQALYGTASDSAIYFMSSDNFRANLLAGTTAIETTQVFRDPLSWYHIVLAVDTTQATSSNRVKLYINGVQVTALNIANYPAQNADTLFNQGSVVSYIGSNTTGGSLPLDGYLSEVNFIDGQALTPSSFGRTDPITGVWQAIPYTGTYGTNGFYLNFSNNASTATLGYDTSGNANNWTTNNFSLTAGSTYDSMADVPTAWQPAGTLNSNSNSRGNYAVLNPLNTMGTSTGYVTASNANLTATTASANWGTIVSSIAAPATGYWYAEFTAVGTPSGSNDVVGILLSSFRITANTTIGGSLGAGIGYSYQDNGLLQSNNVTAQTVASMTSNNVIMVALGNGKLWFGKDGVWLGSGSPNPATATSPIWSGITGDFCFGVSVYNSAGVTPWNANFGQRPFSYTPPSGFLPLNTYNLPASTIVQGNTVMDATLWTGTGSANTITNAAPFKPDLVWIKSRSDAGFDHNVFDSVRGVGNTIFTNTTGAEQYSAQRVTAFNSNGFSLGTADGVNRSASSFVGWQWQAGQGTTSSNTSGSITSTVSVNASAGFSVVTYTGLNAGGTIGHGLGVAPSMVIFKNRTSSPRNWRTYHTSIGTANYLNLNTTAASANDSGWFGASSTTLNLNGGNDYCATGSDYVAYCWSEIAGFSKFGSYTGNGSTDGPFVFLGFRPKFVLLKDATTAGGYWEIHDSSRNTYNATTARLFPNLSSAELTGADIDFLSNGFKLRTTDGTINNSGSTVIFAAFAENPFKNALAR